MKTKLLLSVVLLMVVNCFARQIFENERNAPVPVSNLQQQTADYSTLGPHDCLCLTWTRWITLGSPRDFHHIAQGHGNLIKYRNIVAELTRAVICTVPVNRECRVLMKNVDSVHQNDLACPFLKDESASVDGLLQLRFLCWDGDCPCLRWSKWYNNDKPNYDGDVEILGKTIPRQDWPCPRSLRPLDVECRTSDGRSVSTTKNRLLQCDLNGFQCLNDLQEDKCACEDYMVRFLCLTSSTLPSRVFSISKYAPKPDWHSPLEGMPHRGPRPLWPDQHQGGHLEADGQKRFPGPTLYHVANKKGAKDQLVPQVSGISLEDELRTPAAKTQSLAHKEQSGSDERKDDYDGGSTDSPNVPPFCDDEYTTDSPIYPRICIDGKGEEKPYRPIYGQKHFGEGRIPGGPRPDYSKWPSARPMWPFQPEEARIPYHRPDMWYPPSRPRPVPHYPPGGPRPMTPWSRPPLHPSRPESYDRFLIEYIKAVVISYLDAEKPVPPLQRPVVKVTSGWPAGRVQQGTTTSTTEQPLLKGSTQAKLSSEDVPINKTAETDFDVAENVTAIPEHDDQVQNVTAILEGMFIAANVSEDPTDEDVEDVTVEEPELSPEMSTDRVNVTWGESHTLMILLSEETSTKSTNFSEVVDLPKSDVNMTEKSVNETDDAVVRQGDWSEEPEPRSSTEGSVGDNSTLLSELDVTASDPMNETDKFENETLHGETAILKPDAPEEDVEGKPSKPVSVKDNCTDATERTSGRFKKCDELETDFPIIDDVQDDVLDWTSTEFYPTDDSYLDEAAAVGQSTLGAEEGATHFAPAFKKDVTGIIGPWHLERQEVNNRSGVEYSQMPRDSPQSQDGNVTVSRITPQNYERMFLMHLKFLCEALKHYRKNHDIFHNMKYSCDKYYGTA